MRTRDRVALFCVLIGGATGLRPATGRAEEGAPDGGVATAVVDGGAPDAEAAAAAVDAGAPLDAAAPEAASPAPSRYQSTVGGRVVPPSRGSGDYQIDVGKLKEVPRKAASELLKLAPGVHLQNEGSEAHADQVFLRGFDAREGQDIEFSVGGVPVNESGNLHGNGYADTHFVLPELVTNLRVVEGPFDPRQGNYAVAGSADFELGLPERGLTAKVTGGSFGTWRGLLLWGPSGQSQGTFVGAELYQTAGFGQNRDGRRGTLMAQYAAKSGDTWYRAFAQAYIASFHSAGVLREDDVEAGRVDFFGTYDTLQGAESSRYSVSVSADTRTGDMTFRNLAWFMARPFRLRENFTGFLLDPQEPRQNLHLQRGDLIDLSSMAFSLGLRGSARLARLLWGSQQALEVGYFARGDFVSGSQARVEAATGHPYAVETDLDSRLGDLGLYADADLHPLSWLTLRGGVRADLFTYDVLDRCAVHDVAHPSDIDPPDASCLHQQNMGNYREPFQRASTIGTAVMPRATVVLGPLWGISASAAYGEGVRSIDPIYITQDARTPFAAARSVEGGLAWTGSVGSGGGAGEGSDAGEVHLSARATAFSTRVDRDLIFSEIAGRNVLGGATTRTGVAGSLRAGGSFFDVSTNVTWVRAVFEDTGLLLPYVPDLVVRADGALFGELPWERLRPWGKPIRANLSAGVTFVAPRPLPQSERSNSIFTLDASASLRWWILELGVQATNLTDYRYRLGEYNYVSDFRSAAQPTLVAERHFSAGAPRGLFFTLGVHLGGAR